MNETETRHTQRGRTETEFARPGLPVLAGPAGILYDFNYGCRVQVPVDGWRVRMTDLDTFNVLLDEAAEANEVITSRRKYFVRFLLEVFDGHRLVFSHAFDATNQKVRLRMQPLALGDSLAWLPVIDAFREQHKCELYMPLGQHLQPLYRDGYPHLHIATDAELDSRNDTYYATYYLGLLKPFSERDHQPTDPRVSNMQDMMAYLLGVPCEERRPNVVIADKTRTIAERYVCIATQSTAQCKYWNNPRGWPTLIEHLKTLGYRVLCIDRDKQYGNADYMNLMPEGAEDFTGNRPLQERMSLLHHADFYRIGKWTIVARMGRRHARGHDQRLFASVDRVPHAVSRDQLSRLQQLLQRHDHRVRCPEFRVVPPPLRQDTTVSMYGGDHP